MELILTRVDATAARTIGHLVLDGRFALFTIEPSLARLTPIAHPAIPPGRYRIDLVFSPHFQRHLAHLVDVPGRADILIHSGNYATDTQGCIIVGYSRAHDSVVSSRLALAALQPQIAGALARQEPVTLTVQDPSPEGALRA
jgi:hypothetical protein